MHFQTPIAVLALISSAAAHPAAISKRATCDVSTSLACQVSSALWTKATLNSTATDYTYQQTLCFGSGELDLSWPTALAGCAECIEASMDMTYGTVLEPVEIVLYGNEASGGSLVGYCKENFTTVQGSEGLSTLMGSGMNLTMEKGLPVLFFNATMMN